MPVKSPSKPGAIPVPKVLNLLEACRSCCHASAAAICQSLSKSSPAQAAIHFSTADASGWTPLLYAARNGWPDVVEHCLAGAQGSPHTARLQSSGNTGRCILCWQHSLHWDNSADAARCPSIVHQLLWQLFDCRQGLGTKTTSCCSRLSSGRTVVLPGAPALSLAICLHLHRYIQQIALKTPKTSCNVCTQHCGTHRIAVSILPLARLCLPPRSPPCSASPSSSPWSPRRHSCTASSLTAAQPVPSAGAAAAGVATMQPKRTQTRTRAPQPFCSCFEPERQGI